MKTLPISERVKPVIVDGLAHCSEECPSHDGKRCEVTGMHGDTFCGPQGLLWDEQSTTFAVKYAQLRELFKVTHLSLEIALTFLEEFVEPDIRGDGLRKRVSANLPRLQEVERKAREERAK